MNQKSKYNKRRYSNNYNSRRNSNKGTTNKSKSLFQVSMIENPWEILEKEYNITSGGSSDHKIEILNNLYSSYTASVEEFEDNNDDDDDNNKKKKNKSDNDNDSDNNNNKVEEDNEADEVIVYDPSMHTRFHR